MKFKEDAQIVTGDFWYDMFEGYIKPKCLQDNLDDILAVEKAKYLLIDFKEQAEKQNVLEWT